MPVIGDQRTEIVQLAPIGVDHPPQKFVSDRQVLGAISRAALGGQALAQDGGDDRRLLRPDQGSWRQAIDIFGWHHEQAVAGKSHDLGFDGSRPRRLDANHRAER